MNGLRACAPIAKGAKLQMQWKFDRENSASLTQLFPTNVMVPSVYPSNSYQPPKLPDGLPFRTVNPRCARFGVWYGVFAEVRRVPVTLALPRRIVHTRKSRI